MNKIKKIIAFLGVSLLISSATSCTDIASENESEISDNTATTNDNLNIGDDKSDANTDIASENESDISDNTTTNNDNLNISDDKSDMIASPISSDEIIGSNYSKIINTFSAAGFTNIHTEKIEDLIIGFLVEDGEIEEISINGNTTFNKTDYFPPDAEIIIKYHTYPESNADETETKSNIEKEADKIRNETDNKADELQILNETNCQELYDVLHAKSEFDPIHGQFARKYVDQIIEFDGYTADVAPHDNYKTRFDFLILYGDYNVTSGPYFQFRDVNYNDLNLKGENVPDSFGAGLNIHIVAKIIKYEETSGLFLLDPVEIYMR